MTGVKGRRILVADDDAVVLKLLQATFAKDGYEVDLCEDGQAALEKLEAGEYSLLVTDLEMPRKSGLELIRAVREKGDLPIIVITGTFNQELLNTVKGTPGVQCIGKPWKTPELRAAVRKALGRK